MPTELVQVLGNLPFFALACIVAIVAIVKLTPVFSAIAAANNRLAESYAHLSETLVSLKQESSANVKAIGGLAETHSLNGAGQAKALDLIATSLNSALDRQKQYGDATIAARDTSAQTLASVLAVGGQVSGMEEMTGEILSKVLDLSDAMKNLNHRAVMTPEDWKPLDEMLAGVEKRIIDAIAQRPPVVANAAPNTAPTVIVNTAPAMEAQSINGNVPPEATDKKD